jgi:polyisoprenoid-binding protein YceI
MKKLLFAFALAAAANGSQAQSWNLDKSHSSLSFSVEHMVVSETEGTFKNYNVDVQSSKPDFTDAQISFEAEVGSINTENEMRDNHLKSDDFFNAEKFPKISFKSSSLKKISDKKYVLEGDLSIRDVTKKVKLDVTYGGTIKDPYGMTRAGFRVSGSINRFDYNLKWSNKLDNGGLMVGENVNLDIKLEITRK